MWPAVFTCGCQRGPAISIPPQPPGGATSKHTKPSFFDHLEKASFEGKWSRASWAPAGLVPTAVPAADACALPLCAAPDLMPPHPSCCWTCELFLLQAFSPSLVPRALLLFPLRWVLSSLSPFLVPPLP